MGTTGFRCKSMNILKLYKFTLASEGGVDCCCRAAVGDAAEILLKGDINKIEDNFYLGYREAFRRLQKDFRPAEASCPDWLR